MLISRVEQDHFLGIQFDVGPNEEHVVRLAVRLVVEPLDPDDARRDIRIQGLQRQRSGLTRGLTSSFMSRTRPLVPSVACKACEGRDAGTDPRSRLLKGEIHFRVVGVHVCWIENFHGGSSAEEQGIS